MFVDTRFWRVALPLAVVLCLVASVLISADAFAADCAGAKVKWCKKYICTWDGDAYYRVYIDGEIAAGQGDCHVQVTVTAGPGSGVGKGTTGDSRQHSVRAVVVAGQSIKVDVSGTSSCGPTQVKGSTPVTAISDCPK